MSRKTAAMKPVIKVAKQEENPAPDRSVFGFLYHSTDSGNATRFAHQHGDNAKFVSTWAKWLVWSGTHWAEDHAGVKIGAMAGATAKRIYDEISREPSEDKRKELVSWAIASESKHHREAMVSLARCEPGIAVAHDVLDCDKWILPVMNGSLDLHTGKLREHRREDFCTRIAPIEFDTRAACPTWDRFLDRVMGGDKDLVSFLRRAVGYSLTGEVEEHVLFFLHGEGANGKSTFCRALIDLLGPYAKQAAPNLLLEKRGECHPTEQADLFGARVVVAQEIDEGRAWAESTLKSLTGGDRVTARRMRENFWTFEPSHKIWVGANNRPRVKTNDVAMWRRIKLVPFAVTIPEAERDHRLQEKLRGELPGILAWAVRGCMEWQNIGLSPPKAVEAATQAYRADEDVVARFIEDRCTLSGTTGSSVLYRSYLDWTHLCGEKPLTQKAFFGQLQSRFGEEARGRTKHGRSWSGLSLRSVADEFSLTS